MVSVVLRIDWHRLWIINSVPKLVILVGLVFLWLQELCAIIRVGLAGRTVLLKTG